MLTAAFIQSAFGVMGGSIRRKSPPRLSAVLMYLFIYLFILEEGHDNKTIKSKTLSYLHTVMFGEMTRAHWHGTDPEGGVPA